MESGRNISGGNGGHSNGGSQKVGNVNVQIGDKEGIYAGSAFALKSCQDTILL